MLKVFEAFSGVGAQHMALRNLGKSYKIVATSDIDIHEILSYYCVHCLKKTNKKTDKISTNIKRDFLLKRGIGNKNKIIKLKDSELNILYNACVLSNNLGDITKIKLKNIPDHDLFTYSFPCQDISSVGTKRGLKKGSGTRSSLLWECQRIIEFKKPKYLMLENVKNFTTGKNKKYFIEWLDYLKGIGYDNYWNIFDSKDYGIPQRRPRVIVISKLGKSHIDLIKKNKIKELNINDILDVNENSKFKPFLAKALVNGDLENNTFAFLDDRDWKINGVMINKYCSTQRAGRSGLKCITKNGNKLYERKLSALECCRLMGFNDDDYNNMKKGNLSEGTIMKICGNSIAVPVLENVFINIFEEEEHD